MATSPNLSCFLAGGAVRNFFLDPTVPFRDLDIFVDGPNVDAVVAQLAASGRMTTTPFGSPRWQPPFDGAAYADVIPIRNFVPGLWPCEDIVDVLNQFDFTASAVAIDLRTWAFHNPQNGLRDIARRRMRMVRFDFPDAPFVPGAPLTRHAVLWFRIIHYASVLPLWFEPLTREWLDQHRDSLARIDTFSELFFVPNLSSLEQL